MRSYFKNFLSSHVFDKSLSVSLGDSTSLQNSSSNPGSPVFSPMFDHRKSVHEATNSHKNQYVCAPLHYHVQLVPIIIFIIESANCNVLGMKTKLTPLNLICHPSSATM